MLSPVNKEILRLAIPSILANITVPLVGMVDIAVAGHLGTASDGAAALIGGIAIGTMLFDLLYWNFGFLRVSTGGMTAQAFGRGDMAECGRTLLRSTGVALLSALLLIAIQWLFVKAAFLVVECSPQVRALATEYFFIRIWAAPATLSLMALKGWFIGMQDSMAAMVTDLVVNGVNIAASIVLSAGAGSWEGLGFAGVAWGTVTAQFTGLATAAAFVLLKYRRKVFTDLRAADALGSLHDRESSRFFSMNGDIFVRSLCFIAIYIGYTVISARYGDTLLASCSILMKLLMIFSYFSDGFAYAGEAMTGKYIGAEDERMVRLTVRQVFVWTGALAAAFMFIYGFGGNWMLGLMTTDTTVVGIAGRYIPWLLLMPLSGCAAFAWDGIFIGATASKAIRNAMLWATLAFFAVWFAGIAFTGSGASEIIGGDATRGGITAIHILMGAYFAHLLARTVYLTARWRYFVLPTRRSA